MITERRRFLAKAGGVMAAAAAGAIVDAPNVIAQPKIQWRMSTAFTAVFDIHQGAAQRLAKAVEEMSVGRFRIEVFPAGQIMQPFECFDAASQGTIEAFMASPQYWTNKEPALEWFGTIPFGMNPQRMTAWYHQGDGLKLWEETYAAFNLVLRDLKKLATEAITEQSEKTPMARKVHASFTKFQALVGPLGPRRRRCLPSVRGGVR